MIVISQHKLTIIFRISQLLGVLTTHPPAALSKQNDSVAFCSHHAHAASSVNAHIGMVTEGGNFALRTGSGFFHLGYRHSIDRYCLFLNMEITVILS